MLASVNQSALNKFAASIKIQKINIVRLAKPAPLHGTLVVLVTYNQAQKSL